MNTNSYVYLIFLIVLLYSTSHYKDLIKLKNLLIKNTSIQTVSLEDKNFWNEIKLKKQFKFNSYKKIINLLIKFQKIKIKKIKNLKNKIYKIPIYSKNLLIEESDLFYKWYLPLIFKKKKVNIIKQKIKKKLDLNLSKLKFKNKIFVHRDFHISNLMKIKKDKIGIIDSQDAVYGNVIDIEVSEFWIGFTTLASNLRFDILLLLLLLPVSVGLFLKARMGSKNSISLLVLISGTILVTPVLEMITDYYFVYPYRYVPLVVFFAIGLSTLFSKTK